MNNLGANDATDLLVRTRSALIDAVEALKEQQNSIIVIGAQAVFLHAGTLGVALAETTKDTDFALDPRTLADDPHVEDAMRDSGFYPSPNGQPGAWVTPTGIPVDLMVPEALAGKPSRRSVDVLPHDGHAMRRARGLEAVLIDNQMMPVSALDPADDRVVQVRVAGPAALLVAKAHKIWERVNTPHRLNDKDAHDAYRLLHAFDTPSLSDTFLTLLDDDICGEVTQEAVSYLAKLFSSPASLGARMAGRAEEGVGDPEFVASAVSLMVGELVTSLSKNSRN